MVEKTIEIRWRDLDGLGHVNNAVFSTYAEEVRGELYQAALGTAALPHFVLVSFAIQFRAEVVLRDDVVVATSALVRLGTSSIETAETISASGRLCAEARSVMVAYDHAERRARPLSDAERAALSALAGRA